MSSSGTGDDAGEAHLRPGRRGPRRGAAGATARAPGAPGQGRRPWSRLVQAGADWIPGPSVPYLEVPDDGAGRRGARAAPDGGARSPGDSDRGVDAPTEAGRAAAAVQRAARGHELGGPPTGRAA